MPTTKIDKLIIDGTTEDTTANRVLVQNPTTKRINWQTAPTERIEKLETAVSTVVATIDNRVSVIEGLQNLDTNFTARAYAIWTGVGLIYDVFYPSYYIKGVLYPGATTQIILDPSDVTFPRRDAIAVNATGAVKITGIAALNPVDPTIDTSTTIVITTILINANETIPANALEEVVYKENVEWTHTSDIAVIDFAATTTPYQGTKHIETGAIALGKQIFFSSPTLKKVTDYNALRFRINLKAVAPENNIIFIYIYKDNNAVSKIVYLTDGSYNYDRTIINEYQTIVVPMTDFEFFDPHFDSFNLIMIGANDGFRLDDIVFTKEAAFTSPLQKAFTSIFTDEGVVKATQSEDNVTFRGFGGIKVKAVSKEIYIINEAAPYVHDFTSTPGQQDFVIPDGFTANAVFLNRTLLMLSEYTFVNNTLTIIETLETGTIISTR